MSNRLTRRQLLRNSALAGVGVWTGGRIGLGAEKSPNEKLNIACIGVGHRGAANLKGVVGTGENILALCDVDLRAAAKSFEQLPKARQFRDFRKMLDQIGNQIDAVVVSTPDHTHAPAAMMAMRMGKHCYCEKPLTNKLNETRAMRELAKKNKLVTQMGTQIHAGANYRRVVELIRAGAIGQVNEVICWIGRNSPTGGANRDRPTDTPPVPKQLDWDLWLGPAPYRPYHPCYCPGSWRGWWDFGNGTMGDFGCHYIDLPFWALGLRYPTSVEASGSPPHPETVARSIKCQWQFPAEGKRAPVTISWYNSHDLPEPCRQPGVEKDKYAIMFVGEKGMLASHYGWHRLLPAERFADFKPPEPTIPDSIGHHKEWTEACKTGGPTTCNFDYSGALTETVLLGTVAYKVGKRLEWDAENLKATNCPEADKFINRQYRQGWEL